MKKKKKGKSKVLGLRWRKGCILIAAGASSCQYREDLTEKFSSFRSLPLITNFKSYKTSKKYSKATKNYFISVQRRQRHMCVSLYQPCVLHDILPPALPFFLACAPLRSYAQ
jgi:hypothetical protein